MWGLGFVLVGGFCGLLVLFLQDFQNKQRKNVIREGLHSKLVPYTGLRPVVFQLLCRTGGPHLPFKGIHGICFCSALRDESPERDLYYCFCKAKLCLHHSWETMGEKEFSHIRFCPRTNELNE